MYRHTHHHHTVARDVETASEARSCHSVCQRRHGDGACHRERGVNQNPTFQVATGSDTDRLLDMMRDYQFDGHSFHEGQARRALLALLREPLFGRVWLVCDGDVAVGYVVLTFGYSLEFRGRDAFLDKFLLRPSHRGRGWGRQALEFAEKEARTQACGPSIWRWCAPTRRPMLLSEGWISGSGTLPAVQPDN